MTCLEGAARRRYCQDYRGQGSGFLDEIADEVRATEEDGLVDVGGNLAVSAVRDKAVDGVVIVLTS